MISKTYFIQAGESGPIKIGRSQKVADRLKQLQVGHYERLYLLCETPLCSEQYAHDLFDEYRLSPSGEWFEPGEGLMVFIEKLNIANSHFPTAFTDTPADPNRGWVESVYAEQYLFDFSQYGQSGNQVIAAKCRELGLGKMDYIHKLIRDDLHSEFEAHKKGQAELIRRIQESGPIEAS